MRILGRALIGLCLLALQTLGFASHLITQSAWLEDPTGKWTLEDVQGRPFQPYTGLLSKAYSEKALWIRLDIEAQGSPTGQPGHRLPLVLRVRPPYLDDIRLYDPLVPAVQLAGDQHYKGLQDFKSLNHNFFVQAGDAPRTLWLRIETTSARMVFLELLTLNEALEADQWLEWMFTGYLALLLFFIIWATVHWVTLREPVIGMFAISQVAALVTGIGIFGFTSLVWPEWLPQAGPSYLLSSTLIFSLITHIGFHWQFLGLFRTSRLLLRTLLLMLGLGVLALLVLLSGLERSALQANAVILIMTPLLAFFTALTARIPWRLPKNVPSDAHLSKTVLVGIYGVILLSMALQSGTLLGLFQPGVFSLYGIVLYGAVVGTLVLGLLKTRIQRIQQASLKALIDLKSSGQALEMERLQREDQEKLFAMLAHEIKTPLTTLRLWLNSNNQKRDAMERAIHDMNQIIERCIHAGQLSDQGLKPVWQQARVHGLTRSAIESCRQPDRIVFVAASDTAHIKTDTQMFGIVLGNLLDNACKYSPPLSQVQLSLTAQTHHGQAGWCWTVRNHAGLAGVPDSEQLFVKYYRSAHARRQSGSGLGLFLVKRLLELLGGDIWYASNSDQISFCFWLPA